MRINFYVKPVLHSFILGVVLTGCSYTTDELSDLQKPLPLIPSEENEAIVVTTVADEGIGSLRQAILDANAKPGLDTIIFDSENGPFATPQTITLESELPDLEGELIIDGYIEDRLWKACGVTINGGAQQQVFRVSPGAQVKILNLTVAEGYAEFGGGIVNEGKLVVKGVTFLNNKAEKDGGGLANMGGELWIINSTFAFNKANSAGGAFANKSGRARITNSTFSSNEAPIGGGLFNDGMLLLNNTILANSLGGADCSSIGEWDAAGTHNLIEVNEDCGISLLSEDPQLEPFGGYNGPTSVFPVSGGSPTINMGDNAVAVDEYGEPLVWDQRGNGDPRFVGGFSDIGAFEYQRLPEFVVDTSDDTDARSCTRSGIQDCSLRGAIQVANAMGKAAKITFATDVIRIDRPLPVSVDMIIDGSETERVRIELDGSGSIFTCIAGVEVKVIAIETSDGKPIPGCIRDE